MPLCLINYPNVVFDVLNHRYMLWINFILGSNFIFLCFGGMVVWNRRKENLNQRQNLTKTYTLCKAAKVLDCSQSPIFSWDRLDIPRLTVTGILIFKCTEGAGVGDYRFGRWGGGGLCRLAARNRKRSISMILRKNRGLWTVYKSAKTAVGA